MSLLKVYYILVIFALVLVNILLKTVDKQYCIKMTYEASSAKENDNNPEENHTTETSQSGNDPKEDVKIKKAKPVSFLNLFRFSSHTTKILITFGFALAFASGLCIPIMHIMSASLVNTFVCYGKYINQENGVVMLNGTNTVHISNEYRQFGFREMTSCPSMSRDVLNRNISVLSIIIAVLGGVEIIISCLQVIMFEVAANSQAIRIRCLFFKSILRQNIAWFDDERYGEFISGSVKNMQTYRDAISGSLSSVITVVTAAIASLVLAFVFGWKLALVSIASNILSVITLGLSINSFMKKTAKEIEGIKSASNFAREGISTLKTVIAFGGEQKDVARYNAQLDIVRKSSLKRKLKGAAWSGIMIAIMFGGLALTFWYGLTLMLNDIGSPDPEYETFNVIIVFLCVAQSSVQLGLIPRKFEAISESKAALGCIFQIIDREPEIDSFSEKGIVHESMKGKIEFRSVRFNYPSRPDAKVLNGLSLKINSGETLAIVGESGCGKSTIGHLIQRFYDPLQGEVTIDGTNIADLNIGWLRKNISIVGQEPVLFSKTIAENIRFGNIGATQDVIEKAAKDAFAHSFIDSLPKKYETLLGECQLSGGQKQRIAIARALVGNPKILILDEPTSALDYASESAVMEALQKAAVGRTTIIITHRLSMLQESDQICVISNGKISEYGSSQQLMSFGGSYSHLVNFKKHRSIFMQDDVASNSSLSSKSFSLHSKQMSSRNNTWRKSTRPHNYVSPSVDDGFQEMLEISEDVAVEPSTILQLCRFCLPGWYLTVIGLVFAVLIGSANPLSQFFLGQTYFVMADTNTGSFHGVPAYIAKLFAILAFAAAVVNFVMSVALHLSSDGIVQRLKVQSFKAILRQEMAWFEDSLNGPGKIYSQLEYDLTMAGNAIWTQTHMMLRSSARIIISIIFALVFSWKLGLVFVGVFLLVTILSSIQKKVLRTAAKLDMKELVRANTIAMEAISNIRTVVSFHSEKAILDEYGNEMQKYSRVHTRTTYINAILIGLCKGLPLLGVSVLAYFGHLLVIENEITFSELLVMIRLLSGSEESVNDLCVVLPMIDKSFASLQRIFHLLNRKPLIDPGADDHVVHSLNNSMIAAELNNVSFCYPSRKEVIVLDGINLKVPAHKIVGLVGKSGCGKSTVLQMLLRFYDPQSGVVNVAGHDVKKINLKDLRAGISIVSQEPVLFDRSIEENIAYGDNTREIPFPEIINAARCANIHEFIAQLPDGYKTKVGDKGTFLSGGQKQRIAIARALIRNPKILLLDEATSALDVQNEKEVQEALERAQVGRTSIIVTHRLSAIANADVIFVIHNGKVVEMGTHRELLKCQGYYSSLYDAQVHNDDEDYVIR